MILSEQIAALEEELEGYRNGDKFQELETNLEIAQSELRAANEMLEEYEDAESRISDAKSDARKLEELMDSLTDAADDFQRCLSRMG